MYGINYQQSVYMLAGLSIYREIRVFPRAVVNTGKYREILGNRKPVGTQLWVANIMACSLNQS